MRLSALLLVLLGSWFGPVQQVSEHKLEDLLTANELRDYRRRDDYRHHIDLFRKAFESRTNALTSYVRQQKWDGAVLFLSQMSALAPLVERASATVENTNHLRSGQVKDLEIALRKIIATLQEFLSAAPFEHREHFQKAHQRLEDLRKILLAQLLGHRTEGSEDSGFAAALVSHGFLAGALRAEAEPARPFQSRDRFTEEEFVRIQNNQDLLKRVEVFLDIAGDRLLEIQRRMAKQEWDGEEENPLEFYTYTDMVHAFNQAIDGVMINIDEKAAYKTAGEDEIEKSLGALYKAVTEYIPKLEPVKAMAMETQDRELYSKVLQAEETSLTAQRGALYGLGAPPE